MYKHSFLQMRYWLLLACFSCYFMCNRQQSCVDCLSLVLLIWVKYCLVLCMSCASYLIPLCSLTAKETHSENFIFYLQSLSLFKMCNKTRHYGFTRFVCKSLKRESRDSSINSSIIDQSYNISLPYLFLCHNSTLLSWDRMVCRNMRTDNQEQVNCSLFWKCENIYLPASLYQATPPLQVV